MMKKAEKSEWGSKVQRCKDGSFREEKRLKQKTVGIISFFVFGRVATMEKLKEN